MGYRSKVVLVLPTVEVDKAELSEDARRLLKEGTYHTLHSWNGKLYNYYEWESIKWYSGVDPVISEIENIATYLDPGEWGMVRVGEEFGDLEVHGSPYEFGVYPVQDVTIE